MPLAQPCQRQVNRWDVDKRGDALKLFHWRSLKLAVAAAIPVPLVPEVGSENVNPKLRFPATEGLKFSVRLCPGTGRSGPRPPS